ncbi:allantoinase AllB [Streptomyces sp. SID3343]|uniref:allantoinase AllB n=1 Tax=Streptomyces sp. SID3343 TaxID=2690260 RepID=UPI00136E0D95|nr:allantoinase AllB [Streptomyces sp. SID3343]
MTHAPTLVLRSRRVFTPDGERPADVILAGDRIAAVSAYGSAAGAPVEDLGELALLPGLVDTHVHVNEPGRTAWEGFTSATRAAAAGGVTTLLDMPLNSIPATVTVEALRAKQEVARGRVYVDVGFWGGAIPGNTADLEPLHRAGVYGFKSFLAPSGVDEFPHVSAAELDEALTEQARIGALAIIHAEAPHVLDAAPQRAGRAYADFLASRPDEAETVAVGQLLETAKRTGARVHVLHVSSADVLPLLDAARADGIAVTAETCPHYLTLIAEGVPEGNTAFKCCPPIRSKDNRDRLWDGIRAGSFAAVVSDHSPCTADLKRLDAGDFALAWGGIASLQLGLPTVWTEARARGFALADVVALMSTGPARLAGLARKGAITPGHDADLVAFDPDAVFTVDATALHHRNPVTPYAGRELTGAIRTTWLAGAPVDVHGSPRGRLLDRTETAT